MWIFRGEEYSSPRIDSSPAVAGGAAVFGVAELSVFSPGGRVVCLEAASGERRWHHKTRRPVFSSPAVANGRVFAGEGYHEDRDCRLYCIDLESGRELWTFASTSHIESSPLVDRDRVIFGAGDDGIYCLEAASGKEVWHHPGRHVDLSPWVESGLLFAGSGYGDQAAICLAAKDGTPRWQSPLDLPVWGSPLVIGNRLYLGLGNGSFRASADDPKGAVVCLAAAGGKPLWRRDLGDAVLTAIARGKNRLFCGSRDGRLYALDPASGEIRWKLSAGGPIVASPVAGEKRVAAVSSRGRLVVAAAESGEELASVEIGAILGREVEVYSSPALAGGRLFLGTSAGALICLGEKDQ
jgi:outer membrane protein assembly factor BamB